MSIYHLQYRLSEEFSVSSCKEGVAMLGPTGIDLMQRYLHVNGSCRHVAFHP